MIDGKQVFSDNQSVAATANSTNVVDLGNATPYSGGGYMPRVRVVISTVINAGQLTVSLADSADDSSFTTVYTATETTDAAASRAVGVVLLDIGLPPTIRRYLRLTYTETGSSISSGAVNAYVYNLN